MGLFRLVDEDSMMGIAACMMQMHWKGPMESLSAKRTLEAYALWEGWADYSNSSKSMMSLVCRET